ncbi:MAG: hypothetical protein A3D39_03320 [Candidatus Buchananbacteria bacterium RIFCSPHIGHO2_02_FULL_39_17]|uniref:DUF2079 domain-containing protein n=1 Tax=Candidatus Buchananbacteria bacterium RIFCSPLOWO2_01_FULL_40_23b TaxID=1797544 RepID=A0A1G1YP70_9BACT|nr:MAG: hypothetical protein A3D39_03320 [Candidatus Buchananbacteria bacterium RIFCSPHIGHO2_02_FULL_39_17]OGY54094.1 MAG: hypothetical protein A2912_01845 [Candidatus Buchananbacteria bacterium RIFCSPLOWO2_01_FULL_40_23b]
MINKTLKVLKNHNHWLVLLVTVFYFAFFSFTSFWKYYNFFYNALDLAIINQIFYNSTLGNFFASSIHPPSYLGDHFSPILILLLPVYLIFRQPSTLLLFQTAFLALSVWPLYLIAKNVLTKNWAIIISLAWLANPFVHNVNLFEFSFLPLAIFFIFWTFYFYQQEKNLLFLLFSLLALLVREDVALVILMFGVLALIERKNWRYIFWPIFMALTYFIFALKLTSVFAPNQSYKFLIYYAWLGNSLPEILKKLLFEPWLIIKHLLRFNSFEFILGLLLPTGWLAIIGFKYLLLGLAVFLQLALRQSGASATLLETYYPSLLLPVVFVALIFSLKKITDLKSRDVKNLLMIIFFSAIIYSFFTLSPTLNIFKKIFQTGWGVELAQAPQILIKKIPSQAPVAASYSLITNLSSRPKIYSLNYIFLGQQQFLNKNYFLPADAQYLLVDFSDLLTYQLQYGNNPFYQKQFELAQTNWPKIFENFGLVAIQNNYSLWQKGEKNQFDLVKKLTVQPNIAWPKEINLNEKIKYLGFNKNDNRYELFWGINKPIKNYYLEIKLINQDTAIETRLYPFAYGWLAGNNDDQKQLIQTNYWFSWSKKIPPGDYELIVRLVEIISGGIEIDETRSTKPVLDKKIELGPELNLGLINL